MDHELGKNQAPEGVAVRSMAGGEERITLHGIAHGGETVGRLADGRAVFVDGGVPGETVRIRITESKARWARGELLAVESASADRVAPPCPHFDRCGGCQWQHIAIERQRALKREIVLGQLRHLGGLSRLAAAAPGAVTEESPAKTALDATVIGASIADLDALVEPTRAVGSADGFGYRNHATFALDAYGRTCFHGRGTMERVPIARCLLLHPLLREWHEMLPPLPGAHKLELRAGTRTAQRLAMVGGQPSAAGLAQARAQGIALQPAGQGELTEMVGTERFRISSKSFFQVNTEGAELLVQLVLELLEPTAADTVLDAYAGVGLFTIPLARRAARVFAVESNAAAVRDLRPHAKGLPVHVVGVSLEHADDQLPARVHLVVADPPRTGLGAHNVRRLVDLGPRRIVLVACDAAALARDVAALVACGYAPRRLIPVDLFPHTHHVETVALLQREGVVTGTAGAPPASPDPSR